MNGRCPTTRASGAFFLLLLSLGAPPGKAQAQSGGDSTVIVAGHLGADLLAAAEAGQIDHGADAFEFAVWNDRGEIVGLLLERGSALRKSALNGKIGTAKVLLDHGVDVNSKSDSSSTPLICAVDGR